MATIVWPTSGRAFQQVEYSEGVAWDIELTITRAGNAKTRMMPGWRWRAVLAVPADVVAWRAERQQLEALILSLRGGHNRLQMFNPAKVVRVGTLSGTPLVKTSVGQGASSVVLKSVVGNVRRGDLLGLGTQRVMVTADADPVAGEMTVQFEGPVREAVGADTPVVWDRPTSLFIIEPGTDIQFPYQGTGFAGFSVPLIEVWA